MNLSTYGFLFAAVAHTALLIVLLHGVRAGGQRQGTAPWFHPAVATSAAWGWLGVAVHLHPAPALDIATQAADALRYGFWFLFLLHVLQPGTTARDRRMATLRVAAAVLVASALVTRLAAVAGASLPGQTLIAALALPIFGLILVEQVYRNVSEDGRWGTKPLCLGLVAVFAFDVYFYAQALLFGGFDPDSVLIRAGVHGLSVPLLFVAARRQATALDRLRVSQSAAFHTATLVLVGVYLLFMSGVGYYVREFGGEWGRALQLGLSCVAVIALAAMLLSGSMRAKVRVFIGKNFFRYRYDYRTEWLRFTAVLSTQCPPREMAGLVVRGLADMVESPGGALWASNVDEGDAVPLAHWNFPRVADREPAGSPLCRFLHERDWIVDIDEYRTSPGRYGGLALPPWLLAIDTAWLVVPLPAGNRLVGFVVLAKARTAVEVNWEVRDLLKTASRQAASFLAQMQATEALLEARKFEAFNRMSAFVVHDLKNIVTQLSLMMKNAKRLHANPEFQKDMLATVESSLDKMRQLILQLREGEAQPGGTAGVELGPIARRLQAAAQDRGRIVDVQIADRVVTRGHEQRIERVLGHLVQNAIDATTPEERVWVRVERVSGQARVVVGDTGHGMSQEFVHTRLFRPFTTTKQGGMGIGAYESFQYLRELGGSITVDSEPNRGTVITIVMPLFEAAHKSDLEMLSAK